MPVTHYAIVSVCVGACECNSRISEVGTKCDPKCQVDKTYQPRAVIGDIGLVVVPRPGGILTMQDGSCLSQNVTSRNRLIEQFKKNQESGAFYSKYIHI